MLAAGALVIAAYVCGAGVRPRSRLARLGRGSRRTAAMEWLTATAGEWRARAERSPRNAVGIAATLGGLLAAVGYGPVAGVVVAGYAGAAVLALLRRQAERGRRRALTAALDGLAAIVGDVRAGVNPTAALGAALPLLIGAPPRPAHAVSVADLGDHLDATPRGRLLSRFTAAWRLAEQTGAPLADVLERLDGEVQSGERARAMAVAHAASARATAVLLAVLPLAGIGLGYAIGGDPLTVLLHTTVGGVCAVAAVILQLAGLAWAAQLARVEPEQVDVPEER